MDDILEVVFEIFGFLTPTGRRKKKGHENPESPFSNVVMLILLVIVLVGAICLYPVFNIELTSYFIYATIGVIIAWSFLYIIVINIIDWLYIKYLERLKANK